MANESVSATTVSETNVNGSAGNDVNIQVVDGVHVVTVADTTTAILENSILIQKPEAGQTVEINVGGPALQYSLGAAEDSLLSFSQDGQDLILKFDDESVVVLKNFVVGYGDAQPATLVFSDALSTEDVNSLIAVVDTTPDQDELEEPQSELREEAAASDDEGESDGGQQIAAVEPEAGEPSAQDLAEIEPAAADVIKIPKFSRIDEFTQLENRSRVKKNMTNKKNQLL